jgi:hypothetical protein
MSSSLYFAVSNQLFDWRESILLSKWRNTDGLDGSIALGNVYSHSLSHRRVTSIRTHPKWTLELLLCLDLICFAWSAHWIQFVFECSIEMHPRFSRTSQCTLSIIWMVSEDALTRETSIEHANNCRTSIDHWREGAKRKHQRSIIDCLEFELVMMLD